jgi:16S rRNA processing protein RimM
VSIDAARRADEAILMKLHSIDDRDRAAELRGAVVCARRAEFPPLDAGEFYACDVVGAKVRVADRGGEEIGAVLELRSYPSVDVLVIGPSDGSAPWEVPLVGAFIEQVDVEAGVVLCKTIEGIERG